MLEFTNPRVNSLANPKTTLIRKMHEATRELENLIACPFLDDVTKKDLESIYPQFAYINELLQNPKN